MLKLLYQDKNCIYWKCHYQFFKICALGEKTEINAQEC